MIRQQHYTVQALLFVGQSVSKQMVKFVSKYVIVYHLPSLTNALNINSYHSPTKFLQPANLTTYTILSLFSLQVELAPRLWVTLARPSVSSSLQVPNRSFTYASPYLWNQLPSSFRQPHSVHCNPGSPHPAHHLITVTTFTPITYHCLYISLQT